MRTSLLFFAVTVSSICLAQTSTDSTVIKNKQMIESLKTRINTIDNIGNGENTYQKQLDELRGELARQNDSITKLLNIINELKKYANNNLNNQKPGSTVLKYNTAEKISSKALSDEEYNRLKKSDSDMQNYILSCNCSPLFYKPYQVDLNFKTISDLNEIIKMYESDPKGKIVIVGHADKTGAEPRNLTLSKQRAENLKNYLIIASENIKKEDIEIKWSGSSEPIPNLAPNKEELNRRTEILIK